MPENKNNQHPQPLTDNSGQQSTQHLPDSELNKRSIRVEKIEEWDEVVTDQRRPQFRYKENYGRRNY